MYTIKTINELNELTSTTKFNSIPNLHNLTPGTKERITVFSKSLEELAFSKIWEYKENKTVLKVNKAFTYDGVTRELKYVVYDIDLG